MGAYGLRWSTSWILTQKFGGIWTEKCKREARLLCAVRVSAHHVCDVAVVCYVV